MDKKRVTQRDVDDLAGVSTAVVSYVINNGPRPTSPNVRSRVLQAITELDYHPNGFARGLRSRRAHTIGFVDHDFNAIDCFGSHYLSAILDGLTRALKERDDYLMMYPMPIGEDPEPLNRLLRSGRLDGVILRMVQDSPLTDSLVETIAAAGLPAICIERPAATRFGLSSVTYDDEAGARAATRHLLELGHRRIAHLLGDERFASAQARLKGYRLELQSAGIGVDDALIRKTDWDMSQAVKGTLGLFDLPDPPTAIFAASDDLAIGALEALRASGRAVPAEVAVVGFDDILLAREIMPPLTTVRIPLAEIGRRAAELLVAASQNGAEPISTPIVLPVELIQRGSA
jgi:LacI family transcriptional regulator